jgi:hypothetical protein
MASSDPLALGRTAGLPWTSERPLGQFAWRLVVSSWWESDQPFLPALVYRIYCTPPPGVKFFLYWRFDVTERQNERISRAIERALSEGPFTIQQLAHEAGISYDTLYSWATL